MEHAHAGKTVYRHETSAFMAFGKILPNGTPDFLSHCGPLLPDDRIGPADLATEEEIHALPSAAALGLA